MAKISAYPNGGSPQNSDQFIIARAGRNFKLLWQSVQAALTVIESMFSFSDITTANSDTTKHGLFPKLSGHAGQYLGGDGNWYDLPVTLNLFMDNTASSIAGYKTLTQVRPTAAETNVSASIPAANTVIEEFAAEADQFAFISAQVLHVHVHLAKTAGVKTATVHVSVYHRTSGGTETLLGQSAETGNLTGSSTAYDLDVSVPDTSFASTDRIVIKFFGSPGGAGTDPTVAVYFQGVTNSRIEIGTSPSLSGFAPASGWTLTTVQPTRTAADDPTYTAQFASVDYSSFLTEGTPVKWTQNGVTRYGFVSSAPSYSGGNTTITILTRCDGSSADYDMLDTATYPVTNFAYSLPKSPGSGFPNLKPYWTVSVTDTSDRSVATGTNAYQQLDAAHTIVGPIGKWYPKYSALIGGPKAAGGTIQPAVSLSTSTSSASDGNMTMLATLQSGTFYTQTFIFARGYLLSLAAKTTYYLVAASLNFAIDSINAYGATSTTVIEFESAYI